MKTNNKIILWQKWTNPYELPNDDGSVLSDIPDSELNDSSHWDSYEEDTTNESQDTEDNSVVFRPSTKVIMTPMGVIPLHDKVACTKIFKFWIGHTNFSITNNVASTIEEVNGVETLDIFTRYRFRIAIGKAFADREVMQNIQELLYETKS